MAIKNSIPAVACRVDKRSAAFALIIISLILYTTPKTSSYQEAYTREAPPIIAKNYREVPLDMDYITPFWWDSQYSININAGGWAQADLPPPTNGDDWSMSLFDAGSGETDNVEWSWMAFSAIQPHHPETKSARPSLGAFAYASERFVDPGAWQSYYVSAGGSGTGFYSMTLIYDDGARRVDEEGEGNIYVTDVYMYIPWIINSYTNTDQAGDGSLTFTLMHHGPYGVVVDHNIALWLEWNGTISKESGPMRAFEVEEGPGIIILGPMRWKVGVEYRVKLTALAGASAWIRENPENQFALAWIDPRVMLGNETEHPEYYRLAISPEVISEEPLDRPEVSFLLEQDGQQVEHVSLSGGPATIRAYINGDASTSQVEDPFNSSIYYGWYCSSWDIIDVDGVCYDGEYTFNVDGLEPGLYTIGTFVVNPIGGSSGEFLLPVGLIPEHELELTPEPELEPANIIYESVTAFPTTLETGSQVTITVTLENTGGETGTESIQLLINDQQEDTETLTVVAGATETISFKYIPVSAGTYTAKVDTKTTTFIVTEPQPKPSSGIPKIPSFPIMSILAALAIYILVRARDLSQSLGMVKISPNGNLAQTEG